MLKTTMQHPLSIVAYILLITTCAYGTTTTIMLNGKKTSVYFNDGDTFRVLDGDMKNTRARVAGINSLETYGPVHEWANNISGYLLKIANQATTLAQKGRWNCITNDEEDIFGRTLAICDDLSTALIKEGLAHAYSIDENKAKKLYLENQEVAQKGKLGMWKYGIPQFIIVSLHSIDKDEKEPYNRLISTKDGKSKKWYHQNSYTTCEKVCLENDTSCMTYVPFSQRYGVNRPKCFT